MNKTQYIKGILALSPNKSNKEIAKKCGCTTRMVRHVRQNIEPIDPVIRKESVIGIISDTHIPAEVDGYFEFIEKTFEFWGVNKVVHIGDLIDFHRASRFVSEPGALSIADELFMAKEAIRKWTKAFPNVSWCQGNHDMIPFRQAKEIGLTPDFMKPLHQLLDIPSTWVLKDHFIIDNCYFEHGLGSGGMYGAKNTSLKYRINYIQGHTHANGGVFYSSGPKDTIFGLNVGAGCDAGHITQTYGANYKSKITLGCGIVVNGKAGYFVPMT